MLVKVFDPAVQTQHPLRSFPRLASLLFLLARRAARRCSYTWLWKDLLVIPVSQGGNLPDCDSLAPKLVRMNNFRNVVFPQERGQKIESGGTAKLRRHREAARRRARRPFWTRQGGDRV